MINVAILGFGVVGGGVAELLTSNTDEVSRLGGDQVNIKHILDLRDFPDSPLCDRVIHDFDIILNDSSVDCVIEVMGGCHPAYEYTMSALRSGKSVITSNKEVVAAHGDEFLAEAEKHGVCYRFEAAVGGGIPVIAPMIGFVGHNRITEVRGILNGTTNYILTKMFSFGEGFEESLKDAQDKGYAERNPDADILGYDACRKIAILSSLVTGRLVPTEAIYTEGITGIRKEDVQAAEKLGMQIKLLGRSIFTEDGNFIMVAPFMLPCDSPLSSVSGVYNAVQVFGEPIGSVMFYGPGAGAGATASAVVGDLMQIMRSGRACAQPAMVKTADGVYSFESFESRHYLAVESVDEATVTEAFGHINTIDLEGERRFTTEKMSEKALQAAIGIIEGAGGKLNSHIRLI